MNGSLVSAVQKQLNRKNRHRREWARLALQRRRKVLAGLLVSFARCPYLTESMLPEDALLLMFGDLNGVRARVPQLIRLALLMRIPSLNSIVEHHFPIGPERPSCKARWPKRASFGHLPATSPILARSSIQNALAVAARRKAQGYPDCQILTGFHIGSGIPWAASELILSRHGLVTKSIPETDISRLIRSQEFSKAWRDARRRWAAAVALKQIEPKLGEWGLVEASALSALLPGFSPPAVQRRAEFLIKQHETEGGLIELWFFSTRYAPLFWVKLRYAAEERRRRSGS